MSSIVVYLYNLAILGAVMYTVGYLGWSAWWLLILVFVTTSVKRKNNE